MAMNNRSATVPDLREINRLVEAARRNGEADYYLGKRNWTRFAVGMLLDCTTDPGNPSASWPVTMHNVCEGGFGFWSKRPIFLGTVLFIRELSQDNTATWLPARVTHCTSGIRGHVVGVALGD